MKPSRAGGCLKGARHCPQCNHFFKTEGPRPEPEGNGCGMGRRGPLWGSRSVFLLSEDASVKPSSCLRSGCSVLASLALRSRFYKNMFSRVNSAQLTFCCLTSILIFEAVAVSAFTHWPPARFSPSIDEGKSERCCQAEGLKKKIQMKFARCHGNTLPHLSWRAKGGFRSWAWFTGDRGAAAVTSESRGGCHPVGERVCSTGLCLFEGE